MSDTLKWIAEELLGFEKTGDLNNLIYRHPTRHGAYGVWKIKLDDLQSWHGIGLVVEAMERRGWKLTLQKSSSEMVGWVASFWTGPDIAAAEAGDEPWIAVFAAARKAVEGTEG